MFLGTTRGAPLLFGLLALVLVGCGAGVSPLAPLTDGNAATAPSSSDGSAASQEVRQVVRQYLEAIYDGRAGEAWLMHSAETNQGETFDEFAEAVRVAATLRDRVTIERIGEPRISDQRATVEVVQRLGDRSSTYVFTLVFEKGRWHIHNPRSTTPQGSY
ncbi:MAG TPA: hypothetical protein VIN09_04655 [Chloroflexota bacterium]